MNNVTVLCYAKTCAFCDLDSWECTKEEIIIGRDYYCDSDEDRERVSKTELNTGQPYRKVIKIKL